MAKILLLFVAWASFSGTSFAEPVLTAGIPVKFVHDGAVYLAAGSGAGLAEGQTFVVKREDLKDGAGEPAIIGEIEIESVAPMSAAGKVVSTRLEIVPGDKAYISQESLQQLRQESFSREAQKYPQLASFTQGAPPEQETRESLPKPPLPEVNRFRGRIGVDSGILQVPGSGVESYQVGFMVRADATRLGSTYWNVSGYYRGRVQSRTDYRQETLTDLINRTYHLSLNYENPNSKWVAGFGRLYVPWASSLSTIDGFYAGRRFGRETVALFGGTNPDPSSWNYTPNRQMAGALFNFERGSFESFRLNSTSGIAISRVHWQPDRQFAFFENGIFYKHYLSVYSNQEVDLLLASQNNGKQEVALSRSYFTIRLQPHKMISFDINENYFLNTPTFDTRLIGTGLLDKFLFQGLSGGFRLTLPHRLGLYADTGRSSRTDDRRASWNYLAGISLGDILGSGIRADYRYSRFNSSFGSGTYQALTADRVVGEQLRFQFQAGWQAINSAFTEQNRAHFLNGTVDWYFGMHYFTGLGLTVYRGDVQQYNQYFMSLGYRFDNRRK